MKTPKNTTLGIIGYGCVGQGLHHVLQETQGIKANIKKICIKNIDKPRSIDASYFTTNKYELLDDPEIDVIVELIDDADAALEIAREALKRGKHVVSANKKMIAENLQELIALQEEYKSSFLYEGSCCASIPIIRNLEEYYDNDLLKGVEGIFNGTSNFILSKIFDEQWSFADALKHAQELGFAETDPTSDIEGFDSKFKLCIILLHSFGVFVDPNDVFNYGISKLNDFDIAFAQKNNYRIKLVAKCFKKGESISAYCLPQLIDKEHKLFNVKNEYNGVILESAFSESQVFIGKGAGSNPTGSAVLSDIAALRYNYQYEYRKLKQIDNIEINDDELIKIYFRFNTENEIDTSLFENVYEQYTTPEYSYIIADMSLEKWRKAKWYLANDVNFFIFTQ
jgi:homoserine dehydrogenase